MVRRVIAAVFAVVLAAVGVILVINYANDADERALEGMKTDNVYVAVSSIPLGTPVDDLSGMVETRAVPERFQVDGALTDLDELEGQVALVDIVAGEQLERSRFASPDELRARSAFELPDEAEDLHQVTVPLDTARALGGDIAAGDTVGVIMSFDAKFGKGLYVDSNGNVQWNPDQVSGDDGGDQGAEEVTISLTKLTLEKILVTRVQGGYVPRPAAATQPSEDSLAGGTPEEEGPSDQILVTLALDGGQSEQLVYAMEFGNVWLTYEPEGAEEDDEDIKVIQLPERAGDVLE